MVGVDRHQVKGRDNVVQVSIQFLLKDSLAQVNAHLVAKDGRRNTPDSQLGLQRATGAELHRFILDRTDVQDTRHGDKQFDQARGTVLTWYHDSVVASRQSVDRIGPAVIAAIVIQLERGNCGSIVIKNLWRSHLESFSRSSGCHKLQVQRSGVVRDAEVEDCHVDRTRRNIARLGMQDVSRLQATRVSIVVDDRDLANIVDIAVTVTIAEGDISLRAFGTCTVDGIELQSQFFVSFKVGVTIHGDRHGLFLVARGKGHGARGISIFKVTGIGTTEQDCTSLRKVDAHSRVDLLGQYDVEGRIRRAAVTFSHNRVEDDDLGLVVVVNVHASGRILDCDIAMVGFQVNQLDREVLVQLDNLVAIDHDGNRLGLALGTDEGKRASLRLVIVVTDHTTVSLDGRIVGLSRIRNFAVPRLVSQGDRHIDVVVQRHHQGCQNAARIRFNNGDITNREVSIVVVIDPDKIGRLGNSDCRHIGRASVTIVVHQLITTKELETGQVDAQPLVQFDDVVDIDRDRDRLGKEASVTRRC